MRPVRDIAVVGADLCGLACALACAKAGTRVQLFETAPSRYQGADHLDVPPSMLRDLARLGLGMACLRVGFPHRGTSVVDEAGRTHFEWPTPHLAGPPYPLALGMSSQDLHRLLKTEAEACGVRIRHGAPAPARIDADGQVTTAEGEVLPFDLVLLSTYSCLDQVERLLGAVIESPRHAAWCHAVIPRPPRLDRSTWMIGSNGNRLLLVPMNMRQAGLAVAVDASHAPPGCGRVADLLNKWREIPHHLADLLAGPITPTCRCSVGGAHLPPPWHRDAVLAVGTVWQGVSSAFGLSTAQAIEDAVVLGDLLSTQSTTADLIARFVARRNARAAAVNALTGNAARWILRPERQTDWMNLAHELAEALALPA